MWVERSTEFRRFDIDLSRSRDKLTFRTGFYLFVFREGAHQLVDNASKLAYRTNMDLLSPTETAFTGSASEWGPVKRVKGLKGVFR